MANLFQNLFTKIRGGIWQRMRPYMGGSEIKGCQNPPNTSPWRPPPPGGSGPKQTNR